MPFRSESDKQKFRAAVAGAKRIGRGRYRYDRGNPCCALGHGMAAISARFPAQVGLHDYEWRRIADINDGPRKEGWRDELLAAIDTIPVEAAK